MTLLGFLVSMATFIVGIIVGVGWMGKHLLCARCKQSKVNLLCEDCIKEIFEKSWDITHEAASPGGFSVPKEGLLRISNLTPDAKSNVFVNGKPMSDGCIVHAGDVIVVSTPTEAYVDTEPLLGDTLGEYDEFRKR